jgi:hypothetical protein
MSASMQAWIRTSTCITPLSVTSWGDGPLKWSGAGRVGHLQGVEEETGLPVDVAPGLRTPVHVYVHV